MMTTSDGVSSSSSSTYTDSRTSAGDSKAVYVNRGANNSGKDLIIGKMHRVWRPLHS